MWQKILVTLDATPADRTILEHVRPLARQFNSRIVLLHVADGWAARTYGPDAVSRKTPKARPSLEGARRELEAEGTPAEAELAYGNPPSEIIRWVRERQCDLVAMSTHGHRLLG